MASLSLKNVNKVYENGVHAVVDFNLDVCDQEFVVIVGPSGCGKSTTLRMIAGLESITSGELYIDSVYCNDLLSKDRRIAMVFQSYALYPHMSVYDNIAFGLKLSKEEINNRVTQAAKSLEIEEYLDCKPTVLSGGQQQRVSLARALVRQAKVYLMDEPLSHLDAQLRVQMKNEIMRLHKEMKTTTIYVTHDQMEAMSMADRLVVMNEGRIQQIGTPKEIYERPSNLFVAGFLGHPSMNFMDASVLDSNKKDVILGIRPEDIYENKKDNSIEIELFVDRIELLGHELLVHGLYKNQVLIAKVSSNCKIQVNSMIHLYLDQTKIHWFDKKTTLRII